MMLLFESKSENRRFIEKHQSPRFKENAKQQGDFSFRFYLRLLGNFGSDPEVSFL